MAVAKTIEIGAESTKSFEDAVRQGIETASASVRGIRSAWIKDQQVLVQQGKVTGYRIDMKVTFLMEQ